MEQLTYYKFIEKIASDFGVEFKTEYSLQLPSTPKSVKRFVNSRASCVRIFDGEKEVPYMLNQNQRNSVAFYNAKELRVYDYKTIDFLRRETGAKIKTKKARISEGGGWYSDGTRFEYKDFYCEK